MEQQQDDLGKFMQKGDIPLSRRIYGTRVHQNYEAQLKALPNTAIFIREVIEMMLDLDPEVQDYANAIADSRGIQVNYVYQEWLVEGYVASKKK